MPKSQKPLVIERIYDLLLDPLTGQLSRTIVTATDIQDAKRWCAEHHPNFTLKLNSNPYNFMKDIVRGRGASKMWPERLRKERIFGRQVTGEGTVFEFVRNEEEDEGFGDQLRPRPNTPRYFAQSVSLPLDSRALGRRDEPWLLQVAVNLRIVESHFAIGDDAQIDVLEMTHLQMDLKLRRTQIDAVFLARYADEHEEIQRAIITVEAKQRNQRILTEQIARQVSAAFVATDADLVVPIALAAVKDAGIYVAEFRAVRRNELSMFAEPRFVRDSLFELCPEVPGI